MEHHQAQAPHHVNSNPHSVYKPPSKDDSPSSASMPSEQVRYQLAYGNAQTNNVYPANYTAAPHSHPRMQRRPSAVGTSYSSTKYQHQSILHPTHNPDLTYLQTEAELQHSTTTAGEHHHLPHSTIYNHRPLYLNNFYNTHPTQSQPPSLQSVNIPHHQTHYPTKSSKVIYAPINAYQGTDHIQQQHQSSPPEPHARKPTIHDYRYQPKSYHQNSATLDDLPPTYGQPPHLDHLLYSHPQANNPYAKQSAPYDARVHYGFAKANKMHTNQMAAEHIGDPKTDLKSSYVDLEEHIRTTTIQNPKFSDQPAVKHHSGAGMYDRYAMEHPYGHAFRMPTSADYSIAKHHHHQLKQSMMPMGDDCYEATRRQRQPQSSIRDFLSSWNDDEEEEAASEKVQQIMQPVLPNVIVSLQPVDPLKPSMVSSVPDPRDINGPLPDILVGIEKKTTDEAEQTPGAASERLYVLESIPVPLADLSKYRHLNVINRLPDNVVNDLSSEAIVKPVANQVEATLKYIEDVESSRAKSFKSDFEKNVLYDEDVAQVKCFSTEIVDETAENLKVVNESAIEKSPEVLREDGNTEELVNLKLETESPKIVEEIILPSIDTSPAMLSSDHKTHRKTKKSPKSGGRRCSESSSRDTVSPDSAQRSSISYKCINTDTEQDGSDLPLRPISKLKIKIFRQSSNEDQPFKVTEEPTQKPKESTICQPILYDVPSLQSLCVDTINTEAFREYLTQVNFAAQLQTNDILSATTLEISLDRFITEEQASETVEALQRSIDRFIADDDKPASSFLDFYSTVDSETLDMRQLSEVTTLMTQNCEFHQSSEEDYDAPDVRIEEAVVAQDDLMESLVDRHFSQTNGEKDCAMQSETLDKEMLPLWPTVVADKSSDTQTEFSAATTFDTISVRPIENEPFLIPTSFTKASPSNCSEVSELSDIGLSSIDNVVLKEEGDSLTEMPETVASQCTTSVPTPTLAAEEKHFPFPAVDFNCNENRENEKLRNNAEVDQFQSKITKMLCVPEQESIRLQNLFSEMIRTRDPDEPTTEKQVVLSPLAPDVSASSDDSDSSSSDDDTGSSSDDDSIDQTPLPLVNIKDNIDNIEEELPASNNANTESEHENIDHVKAEVSNVEVKSETLLEESEMPSFCARPISPDGYVENQKSNESLASITPEPSEHQSFSDHNFSTDSCSSIASNSMPNTLRSLSSCTSSESEDDDFSTDDEETPLEKIEVVKEDTVKPRCTYLSDSDSDSEMSVDEEVGKQRGDCETKVTTETCDNDQHAETKTMLGVPNKDLEPQPDLAISSDGDSDNMEPQEAEQQSCNTSTTDSSDSEMESLGPEENLQENNVSVDTQLPKENSVLSDRVTTEISPLEVCSDDAVNESNASSPEEEHSNSPSSPLTPCVVNLEGKSDSADEDYVARDPTVGSPNNEVESTHRISDLDTFDSNENKTELEYEVTHIPSHLEQATNIDTLTPDSPIDNESNVQEPIEVETLTPESPEIQSNENVPEFTVNSTCLADSVTTDDLSDGEIVSDDEANHSNTCCETELITNDVLNIVEKETDYLNISHSVEAVNHVDSIDDQVKETSTKLDAPDWSEQANTNKLDDQECSKHNEPLQCLSPSHIDQCNDDSDGLTNMLHDPTIDTTDNTDHNELEEEDSLDRFDSMSVNSEDMLESAFNEAALLDQKSAVSVETLDIQTSKDMTESAFNEAGLMGQSSVVSVDRVETPNSEEMLDSAFNEAALLDQNSAVTENTDENDCSEDMLESAFNKAVLLGQTSSASPETVIGYSDNILESAVTESLEEQNTSRTKPIEKPNEVLIDNSVAPLVNINKPKLDSESSISSSSSSSSSSSASSRVSSPASSYRSFVQTFDRPSRSPPQSSFPPSPIRSPLTHRRPNDALFDLESEITPIESHLTNYHAFDSFELDAECEAFRNADNPDVKDKPEPPGDSGTFREQKSPSFDVNMCVQQIWRDVENLMDRVRSANRARRKLSAAKASDVCEPLEKRGRFLIKPIIDINELSVCPVNSVARTHVVRDESVDTIDTEVANLFGGVDEGESQQEEVGHAELSKTTDSLIDDLTLDDVLAGTNTEKNAQGKQQAVANEEILVATVPRLMDLCAEVVGQFCVLIDDSETDDNINDVLTEDDGENEVSEEIMLEMDAMFMPDEVDDVRVADSVKLSAVKAPVLDINEEILLEIKSILEPEEKLPEPVLIVEQELDTNLVVFEEHDSYIQYEEVVPQNWSSFQLKVVRQRLFAKYRLPADRSCTKKIRRKYATWRRKRIQAKKTSKAVVQPPPKLVEIKCIPVMAVKPLPGPRIARTKSCDAPRSYSTCSSSSSTSSSTAAPRATRSVAPTKRALNHSRSLIEPQLKKTKPNFDEMLLGINQFYAKPPCINNNTLNAHPTPVPPANKPPTPIAAFSKDKVKRLIIPRSKIFSPPRSSRAQPKNQIADNHLSPVVRLIRSPLIDRLCKLSVISCGTKNTSSKRQQRSAFKAQRSRTEEEVLPPAPTRRLRTKSMFR